MSYKDEERAKEANRERQRRYREKALLLRALLKRRYRKVSHPISNYAGLVVSYFRRWRDLESIRGCVCRV